MNNKKKMVLGAAFIVAIMALAGVGYAVTHPNYEGKTTSAGGDVDVDYIIVKLGPTAYEAASNKITITYNTDTSYVSSNYNTTYTWTGSSVIQHVVTYEDTAAEESKVLKVTPLASAVTALNNAGLGLYYQTTAVTGPATSTTDWEQYTGTDPISVTYTQSGNTLSWTVMPLTPGAAPSAPTATLPTITYLVEATAA